MMSHDSALNDTRAAWQNHTCDVLHLSPTELAMRIRAIDQRVRRSFALINVIIVVQLLVFTTVVFAFDDPIQRIGALLIVGAMVYLAYQIRLHSKHMQAARADVERSAVPSLRFVRAYLETRHEFHSGVWFWSRLVVLLPGLPVLVYGFARATPGPTPVAYVTVGLFVMMIPMAIVIQRRVARGYQAQIDELNRLERESP